MALHLTWHHRYEGGEPVPCSVPPVPHSLSELSTTVLIIHISSASFTSTVLRCAADSAAIPSLPSACLFTGIQHKPMRLHHVLVDSTSALQYQKASEISPNNVRQVAKDLHTVIVSLLRSSKSENFTFHVFNSLLPSAPVCQTLQMSPRTLESVQNEIVTNLRLTATVPSSIPGSDRNASISGVTRVLQRLIRKLHNSRSMYSAKPTKHTVYLLSCGLTLESETPGLNTRAERDSLRERSTSQPSNALSEILGKLKCYNVDLVWILLEPPDQLGRAVLPCSKKMNPLETWAQNNAHLEIKYFGDLLKPKRPPRSPMAFSLQERLRAKPRPREIQVVNVKNCVPARIVFEKGVDNSGEVLVGISNVKILSLGLSTQHAEQETTFLLSHYLNKWESPSFAKAFADAQPRTLKPRTPDEVQAFASFMSFLMRTETVVVANEFTVDHEKHNFGRSRVVIVPYTSNVASVCYIPSHFSRFASRDSLLPKNYNEWQNWHNGGQLSRMNVESFKDDEVPEVHETILSTSFPGNAWQDCAVSKNAKNLRSGNNHVIVNAKGCRRDAADIENTKVAFAPSIQKAASTRLAIQGAKASLRKKGEGFLSKSSNSCAAPKISKAPMTVTKNGFRYKRVSADRPGLKGRLHKSSSNGMRFSSKLYTSASKHGVLDLKSEKSRSKVTASESFPTRIPRHAGTHTGAFSNGEAQKRRSSILATEQTGEEDRHSLPRLNDAAGSILRGDSVAQSLPIDKEPLGRSGRAVMGTPPAEFESGSHFRCGNDRISTVSSIIGRSSFERRSVRRSSPAPQFGERRKRPRSFIASEASPQAHSPNRKVILEKKSLKRQCVDIDNKGRVIEEFCVERPPTSHHQKSLTVKPSFVRDKQNEPRYKGDGNKKVSVDTSISVGEEAQLISWQIRNKTDCDVTVGIRRSNEKTSKFPRTRRNIEVEALQLQDEVNVTSEGEFYPSARADETTSNIPLSVDAATEAIRKLDDVIAELSDPSSACGEQTTRDAMSQLSIISEQLTTAPRSWPELYSLANWRLKSDDEVIASMQAGQKAFFSQDHIQSKTVIGKLWRAVIEAFEQVIWLLYKLSDPKSKVSIKSRKKPELFRRATTILSCAQVTAELTSSSLGSSQAFQSALDVFFNSTLVHFVQAPNHVNLMHWTRNVFEHFEKELPAKRSSANPQFTESASKKVGSSSPSGHKAIVRNTTETKRRSGDRCNELKLKSSRNLSNVLPGRKRAVQNSKPLQNHPAFRRGKAFAGVSKKKKKPSLLEPSSKPTCPSMVLDRLIHMGSLQSSLDAINVPEAKDYDVCQEAVEATDDETDKTLRMVAMAPKSAPLDTDKAKCDVINYSLL